MLASLTVPTTLTVSTDPQHRVKVSASSLWTSGNNSLAFEPKCRDNELSEARAKESPVKIQLYQAILISDPQRIV